MVNFGITCIVFSLFLMFTTTFLLITTSQSPKVSIFFTRNIIHITTKHTPTRVVVIINGRNRLVPSLLQHVRQRNWLLLRLRSYILHIRRIRRKAGRQPYRYPYEWWVMIILKRKRHDTLPFASWASCRFLYICEIVLDSVREDCVALVLYQSADGADERVDLNAASTSPMVFEAFCNSMGKALPYSLRCSVSASLTGWKSLMRSWMSMVSLMLERFPV